MANKDSGFAEVLGAKIFYEARGSGHPLVLIHPEGLDRRVFDDQVPALSSGYRVFRYDRRFSGRTEVEDGPTPASEVRDVEGAMRWLADQPEPPAPHEDLRGLLDRLGVERAHILGLRDGGAVALDFAVEYPGRVGALILADTVVPSVGDPALRDEMVDRGIERAMELQGLLGEALEERDPTAVIDWALGDPSYAASTEATRRKLRRIYADNAYSILLPRGRRVETLSPPAGERLGEIGAPTLLIVTGDGVPGLRECKEALAEGIPGSRTAEVPEASPTMNMDRPEEFNRTVAGFLGGL